MISSFSWKMSFYFAFQLQVKCINGDQLIFPRDILNSEVVWEMNERGKKEKLSLSTRSKTMNFILFARKIGNSWSDFLVTDKFSSFNSIMRNTIKKQTSLKFSHEASLVFKTRASLPQQSKELDKQTKRVNSDIIIKAGVINPVNSTASVRYAVWHLVKYAPGRINRKCFHLGLLRYLNGIIQCRYAICFEAALSHERFLITQLKQKT